MRGDGEGKLEIGQGCSIDHSVTLSWVARPQPMVNKKAGERKLLGRNFVWARTPAGRGAAPQRQYAAFCCEKLHGFGGNISGPMSVDTVSLRGVIMPSRQFNRPGRKALRRTRALRESPSHVWGRAFFALCAVSLTVYALSLTLAK